jgi:hypothetical protein
MEPSAMLTQAVYDWKTGEVFIAHPTKKDVYVTPNHHAEISAKKVDDDKIVDDDNCTYTETVVCSAWIYTPSGPICTQTTTIKKCNCP